MPVKHAYNIGIALSGGFIRGFAHLGAYQALLERGIRPDILSATSAGSLIGVFLADGAQPFEVLQYFQGMRFQDFADLILPRKGIMKIDELEDFVNSHLSVKNIEQLPIPIIINATNLRTGESVQFTEGAIAPRVAASCCMPVLFKPIRIDDELYVDGGVRMNLPISPIRNLCRKVIAINVSTITPLEQDPGIINIAERCFDLMFSANAVQDRALADLLIEPELEGFTNTQLDKAEDIFSIGYDVASDTLKNNSL